MADKKISQLTALSAANLAPSTDVLAIVDTSATETKKVTAKDLVDGALNGGTANGVLYLNGSKVATSGSALQFSGTKLSLSAAGGADFVGVFTNTTAATPYILRIQEPATPTSGYPLLDVVNNAGSTAYFRVDSGTGNVGIGTASPNQKLDVVGSIQIRNSGIHYLNNSDNTNQYYWQNIGVSGANNAKLLLSRTNAGDTLCVDASGNLLVGTTTLTNGISGTETALTLQGNSSGKAASFVSVNAAGTGAGFFGTGSTTGETFVFAKTNHALILGTNNTERGRFTAGGDFEIGSQAGTGTRTLLVQTNTSGDPTLSLSAAGVDSGQLWYGRADSRLYARSSNTGGVYLASGGTSWTAVSDERKKDIIEPISNAAEKVASLRAVVGKYKTDQDGVRRSFLIAQDVQAVFPEAIDASDENELGLSYTDTIPLLVAAIKELKVELDAAKVKIAALEAK